MKDKSMPSRIIDSGEVNRTITCRVKPNGETYIFIYDQATRAEALRTLGRFASNPELSFNWYDAAVVSKLVRES